MCLSADRVSNAIFELETISSSIMALERSGSRRLDGEIFAGNSGLERSPRDHHRAGAPGPRFFRGRKASCWPVFGLLGRILSRCRLTKLLVSFQAPVGRVVETDVLSCRSSPKGGVCSAWTAALRDWRLRRCCNASWYCYGDCLARLGMKVGWYTDVLLRSGLEMLKSGGLLRVTREERFKSHFSASHIVNGKQ